jgi:hypothetical protein
MQRVPVCLQCASSEQHSRYRSNTLLDALLQVCVLNSVADLAFEILASSISCILVTNACYKLISV